jgi:hypothetical protein
MRWLLIAAAGAYLGYLYGKHEGTIRTVANNQTRIEGAADVVGGLQKLIGG